MNSMVKENKMVSPYFLFFLMHSTQTGIGVLNFQSKIIKGAEHEAWISVFALGLLMHIIFFMILYILKQTSSRDILSFHKDVFGKYFGGALNIIITCYFAAAGLFTLHIYIDVLEIWVFDGINSWEYSLLFSILIFYIIAGGFRIVTAISFWGVVIPSFILLSLLFVLKYAEVTYILPLFQHRVMDYFISGKEALPIYLGFETVLVFYPFIKDGERAKKWGHLGLLNTTLQYTIITILTFLFFSQGKLVHLTWPTLTMIKIISFPFLERFEFIFIFTWLLVIMPVICIYLWSAIRTIKLTIPKAKPTFILIGLLAIYHFVNSYFVEMEFSLLLGEIVNYSGLVFLFGYIPFLFIVSIVRKKLKKVPN